MTSKTTSISHWLLEAGQLQPGDALDIYLWDHPGPPPSFQDMRAALYAQYGKDTLIRIHKHGQRISIFIHEDEEARKRFDLFKAPIVVRGADGKRIEIESGFTRELPPISKDK